MSDYESFMREIAMLDETHITDEEEFLYGGELPNTYTIYELFCPIEKVCFYVGQTMKSLKARFSLHLVRAKEDKRSPCAERIRWTLDNGEMPIIRTLEEANANNYSLLEVKWIDIKKQENPNLTNVLTGGYSSVEYMRQLNRLKRKEAHQSRLQQEAVEFESAMAQLKADVYSTLGIDESMPTPVYIYALIDSTNGETFYIGQTHHPDVRLGQHIQDMSITPKAYRIMKCNHQIEIDILQTCYSPSEADEAELETIQRYLRANAPLTNIRGNNSSKPLDADQIQEMQARYRAKVDSRLVNWWAEYATEGQIQEMVNHDSNAYALLTYFFRQCSVTPRYINYVEIEQQFGLKAPDVNRYVYLFGDLGIRVKPKKIEWGGEERLYALISVLKDEFARAVKLNTQVTPKKPKSKQIQENSQQMRLF